MKETFTYVTTLSKYPIPEISGIDNVILLKTRTKHFKENILDIVENSSALELMNVPYIDLDKNIDKLVRVKLISRISKPYVFETNKVGDDFYIVIRYQHLIYMGRNVSEEAAHNEFLLRLLNTYNTNIIIPVLDDKPLNTVIATFINPPIQPASFKIVLNDFSEILLNQKVKNIAFIKLHDLQLLDKIKTLIAYVRTSPALGLYKRLTFNTLYKYTGNNLTDSFLKHRKLVLTSNAEKTFN